MLQREEAQPTRNCRSWFSYNLGRPHSSTASRAGCGEQTRPGVHKVPISADRTASAAMTQSGQR